MRPHLVCRLGSGCADARRDSSEPMPAPKGLDWDRCIFPMVPPTDGLAGAAADAAAVPACMAWHGLDVVCVESSITHIWQE